MWNDLLLLLFPERCVNCNKTGSALCALCERTITTKPRALSPTLATLFDYQHPVVKRALWALKYHRKRPLGKYFGLALYREFFKPLAREHRTSKETIVLVPIPASVKAVAMRGYNHSGLIAESIAEAGLADGLSVTVERHLLYKKRENARQVEAQNKAGREKNVEDLFEVRHCERVRGKTVVLIDDVVTTGSTIDAARKALMSCKPRRVLAVAVAH